jgi:adenylate cyclase
MIDKESLINEVDCFFNEEYEVTEGRVIPDVDDISFDNGTELDLAMVFIDIKKSTHIVDALRRITAARMYKSFLWGVAKIARMNNGELRSFNGDGVLIAFIGEHKRTNATKAALQMSWFAQKVLKPKLDAVFQDNQELTEQEIEFQFGIGIDVGKVLVIRGGIRGENNNDLVWVGNATNFAVKLSGLSKEGFHVYISEDVYKYMNDSTKINQKRNMWEIRKWTEKDGIAIYRSNWTWPID